MFAKHKIIFNIANDSKKVHDTNDNNLKIELMQW